PVPGVDRSAAPAAAGRRGHRRAAGTRTAPEPELRPAPAPLRAPAEQPAALLPADGHLLLLACRAVPAGEHDPRRLRRAGRGAEDGGRRVPAHGATLPQGA